MLPCGDRGEQRNLVDLVDDPDRPLGSPVSSSETNETKKLPAGHSPEILVFDNCSVRRLPAA
jgi:hypothetical protein